MVSVLIVIGYILFFLVLISGIVATLLGLPGTILIVVDAIVFSAFTGWERPGWPILLVLVGLSLAAETGDNLLSALGTRFSGGTGKTSVMAMLGGLAGAIVGGSLSPVIGALGILGGVPGFIVGTVIPPLVLALTGGYLAAYSYERRLGRSHEEATKAGKGALLGRVLGVMGKCIIASIMAAILLRAIF